MTADRVQRLLALARSRRDLLAIAVLTARLRPARFVQDLDYPIFTARRGRVA